MVHKSNDQNGTMKFKDIGRKGFFFYRANDDDDDDFMNDDPAFDDADQENKENPVELGKKNKLYFILTDNTLFLYNRSGSSL